MERDSSLEAVLERVRRFVDQELDPVSQKVDAEDRIPNDVVEQMRKLGLFGLSVPAEYGGLGLSTFGSCRVQEELSRVNACFRTRVSTNNGVGLLLFSCGTKAQKERYLSKIASGALTASFALSEPNAGSDAANLSTISALNKDQWVLNGHKHFVTNGEVADVCVVIAKTDAGITAFLVERSAPGYRIGRNQPKMGLRGVQTCELFLEDCTIPKESVIGGAEMIGRGLAEGMKLVGRGRLGIAAVALGASQRLLELSIDYAKEREQFNSPLASFQAIRFMLAEMATEIEAARQLLYHAANSAEEIKRSSMVKLFCTEMAGRVADKAVQIHGGMGYCSDHPIERFYRDLRLTRIYEGTSEIQKLVIAKKLLA